LSSISSVLAALNAAIAANPADADLRLHVAGLLLEDGQAEAALQHYSAVLATDPVNLVALRGAAAAADGAKHTARALAYRTLVASLTGSEAATPKAATADVVLRAVPPEAPISVAPGTPPRLRVIQGGAEAAGDDGPDDSDLLERPDITLADVGGLEQVKRRIEMAFLAPLRNPEMRKLYGKKLKGGLLMYGPPGCGKTYLARAVAGEVRARFMNVGLSDVLDMYIGESERKLHELFETARRNAPTVIFFDEIDAIGQKRQQQKNTGTRNVVNQLLNEMDSVESDNEGVFILGATNHPWDVDAALRRSGRFDRVVLVLPPDQPAREAILAAQIAGRPTVDVDVKALAKATVNFSGADLAHLCESATELALEEALKSGQAKPISGAHFNRALKEVRPTTRAWFELAKNYAMFANEGGMYDDLLAYIKEQKF
jgi:AAA+ superfamily predicted ATPase